MPVQVCSERVDNANYLWFVFPHRLPKQIRGVKALYKRVIIHKEMDSHETCKVLVSKKGALTKRCLP